MRLLLLALVIGGTVTTPAMGVASGDDAKRGVRFTDLGPAGGLHFSIDGQEALVFQYGPEHDLAHFYPVRSPSGRSLTVQRTDPYPHHRSFWFADTVRLAEGREVSFYNAYYSGQDTNRPGPPFRNRIRLQRHAVVHAAEASVRLRMDLAWETDAGRTRILEELRDVEVRALGRGEYLLDLTFQLTPAVDSVEFVSDWVHYAWPFIRIAQAFAAPGGGRLVNSEGASGEKNTNGKPARWVDFSSNVDGIAEGLAIFSHPSNPGPHGWLTRDYGVFGPRREDARSGRPFVVRRGETIRQRVAVLVHRGDVRSGRVAERYDEYARTPP